MVFFVEIYRKLVSPLSKSQKSASEEIKAKKEELKGTFNRKCKLLRSKIRLGR